MTTRAMSIRISSLVTVGLLVVLGFAIGSQAPAAAQQGGESATSAASDDPVPGAALEPSDRLVLRPGDVVRLQVKDEPHFSGEFAVNEDGRVLFPLVGLVRVAARPFGEVREELHAAFAEEVRDPVVVATPLVRIAVLGEVRAPGLIPVDPTVTLADVLASVGGLAPRADERGITLVRDGEVVVARMAPGATLLDTRLRSGDQIVVEREGWFREHMAVFVSAAASVAAAAVTTLIVRR